jgi:hypothetical protein
VPDLLVLAAWRWVTPLVVGGEQQDHPGAMRMTEDPHEQSLLTQSELEESSAQLAPESAPADLDACC